MVLHRISCLVVTLIALTVVASCQSSHSDVPSVSEFTEPAVGTLMVGGHEEAVAPNLAADQSGALFVNKTGYQIQVVVSNTIADIPIGHDFLFLLPPGKHEFYIYEPDRVPRVHTEELAGGKMRYLYITRLVTSGQ